MESCQESYVNELEPDCLKAVPPIEIAALREFSFTRESSRKLSAFGRELTSVGFIDFENTCLFTEKAVFSCRT